MLKVQKNSTSDKIQIMHFTRYLKVVSKGPRTKHLEEGVMVDVLAHVVQVVVFSSCAYALLRVGSTPEPGHGVGRVDGVEEDGLELRRHGQKIGLVVSP